VTATINAELTISSSQRARGALANYLSSALAIVCSCMLLVPS
jgi:hypothetical protein